MKQYLDAVKYYSLTAGGLSQVDAYMKVFPERMQARLDRDQDKDDMRGEASRFNATELVNRIRDQALVPLHLVNQGNLQLAINTLVQVATKSRSDIARVNAASALLKELKAPETQKIELDIGVNTTDSIAELRKATEKLAIQQAQSIDAGIAVKQIAESTIIEAEVEEDE
jgi:hypothetical protein